MLFFASWTAWAWQRRAVAAERQLIKFICAIRSVGVIGAVARGERPIATKAPEGMTMEEAQAHIDSIYVGLIPRRNLNS